MLHVYLRLVVVIAIILVGLAILHFVLPLLLTAAIAAAIVLGLIFLINLFRRRGPAPPITRYPS
jgi:predicted PurR-regulated permease PerM